MSDDENQKEDLPFRAEYAKSGKSSCKECKGKIEKGELRLGIMVPFKGGEKIPNWYRLKCFFIKNKPKSTELMEGFDKLKDEDKDKIKSMLKEARENIKTVFSDFSIEYAKSGSSKCGICEEKIKKGEIRVGKKIYDTRMAKLNGPYDRWYRLQCFADKSESLEFYDNGDKLNGISTLSEEDAKMVSSKVTRSKKRLASSEASENGNSKKLKLKE